MLKLKEILKLLKNKNPDFLNEIYLGHKYNFILEIYLLLCNIISINVERLKFIIYKISLDFNFTVIRGYIIY